MSPTGAGFEFNLILVSSTTFAFDIVLVGTVLCGFSAELTIIKNILGTRVVDSKKNAAPAFSFGQKHFAKPDTYGPGPAQYNITGLAAKGKDTPPAMSLQSRPRPPKIIETPGAGEYHLERSEKTGPSAPKYTFGVKKYCNETSQTPGIF